MTDVMELTIGGQTYEFKFGIGFVKSINPTSKRTEFGCTEDIGLQAAIVGIGNGDVAVLEQVLLHANKGHKPRINEVILDEFIDDEETDIDALFVEVADFFRRSNATKKMATVMLPK